MPIKIPIETTFDPKGTASATKALEQVAAAKAKLAQSDATIAASAGKVAAAQNQGAISAAKLAQAQNQAAVAAQKLATEEQRTATQVAAAAAAETRAEKAALSLAQAQTKAASGSKSLGDSLSQLVTVAGSLGIAMGAQQIIQSGIAMAELGAKADIVSQRFETLSSAGGAAGSAILGALRSASGGEISDLNLELSANRAQLLGVAHSAEQFSTLMAIARDRAQQLGTTTASAFDDLVVGLGRGSPKILDNLGIIVKESEVNDAYAKSIGKTTDALTDAEKKQALINAVLAQGAATMASTGGAADGAATSFARLGSAAENAQAKVGSALANILAPAAEGATAFLTMDSSGEGLSRTMALLAGSIVQAGGAMPATVANVESSTFTMLQAAQGTQDWISRLRGVEPAAQAAANAAAIDAVETQRLGTAQVEAANAATAAAAAIHANATATGQQLVAAQGAEEKTRLLAEAQTEIAGLGASVASGLITSANAAATLASQYGITAAAAELLINAQARIAGGKARLAGQAAQTRDLTNGGIGFNAPGRGKGSDADILATINKTQAETVKAEAKGQIARTSVAKAGGAARASTAQSTADQLVSIERGAADKIMALNQRLADAQIAAQRKLASDIGTSTADMIADQEANDLDLIGAKEGDMDRLRAREEAEANARVAQAAAVSEAQARAAAGDAETASAVLDIREQSIQKQQSLDEAYAAKRTELAGNPEELAALKQQYDEATQAAADAAAVRVGLAEAEAAQKKIKAEEEKQAAINAASEAATALAATGKSAATARDQVNAMIARLAAIPTSVTTTINVKTVGGGAGSSADSAAASSSGGSVASAGGGTFMTSGPTHFTVGDNPGGHEIVSVTPVGAAGRTSVSGNVAQMAGGGVVDVGSAANDAQRRLDEANARAVSLAGSLPRAVAASSGRAGGGGGGSSDPGDVMSAIDKAISLLDKIASLRDKLAEVGPPINMAVVSALADEAFAAAQIMGARWVHISKDSEDEFKRFASTIENAIGVLDKAAGLRGALTDIGPPISMDVVANLAYESEQVLFSVRRLLRPIGEKEADEIKRFTEASGNAIGLLADASKLNAKEFSDYQPPSQAQITRFVEDADMVVQAIYRAARVYDTTGLAASKTYADALGGTFTSLTDGLKFIEALNTGDYSIDMNKLARFTSDSMMLLDKTQAIGANAATIPAGNIAAINAAAGALSAYGDSMIKISAVPDIQSMNGYAGGGGSSTNMGGVNIVINAPMGMDVNALAQAVILKLNNAVGARR